MGKSLQSHHHHKSFYNKIGILIPRGKYMNIFILTTLFFVSSAFSCPNGLVMNKTLNRCLTSDEVTRVKNRTSSCGSTDYECYRKNAEDELNIKAKEDKNYKNLNSTVAGKLVSHSMNAAAVAAPLMMVTSKIKNQVSGCSSISFWSLVAGSASLVVGENLANYQHKRRLKKLKETLEKKFQGTGSSDTNSADIQNGNDNQSEAFEMLAQAEDSMVMAAKTKKTFFAIARAAFAASAAMAIFEMTPWGQNMAYCKTNKEKEEEKQKAQEEADRQAKAQEAQEAKKAQEAKEAQEAKKAQEAQEAKKALEAKKAQEAQEAKKAQEAQEAKKALEAKKAQEALEAKKAQEALEAKKAQMQNNRSANTNSSTTNGKSNTGSGKKDTGSGKKGTWDNLKDSAYKTYEYGTKFIIEKGKEAGKIIKKTFDGWWNFFTKSFIEINLIQESIAKDVSTVAKKALPWNNIGQKLYTPLGRSIISGVLAGWSWVMVEHAKKQIEVSTNRAKLLRNMKQQFDTTNASINPCTSQDRNGSRSTTGVCQKQTVDTRVKASNYFGIDEGNFKGCISSNSQFDESCQCRQTNSCMKALKGSLNGLDAGTISMIKSSIQPLEKLTHGMMGSGSVDADGISTGATRMLAATEKLEEKVLTPTQKNEKKKLTTQFENESIKAASGLPSTLDTSTGSNLPSNPFEASKMLQGEIDGASSGDSDGNQGHSGSGSVALPSGGVSGTGDMGSGSDGSQEKLDFGLDTSASEEAEVAEVMNKEVDYGNHDVNTNSSSSLFEVLSNRYKKSAVKRLFESNE
jgi:hypothetical protein